MNLTTVNHNCAYYHTVGLTQFSITERHTIVLVGPTTRATISGELKIVINMNMQSS